MVLIKSRLIKYLIIIFSIINCYAAVAIVSTSPEAPTLNTSAYILMDYNSGKILLDQNSEQRLEPASLTKIMTVYVIDNEIKAGRLSVNEEVTISKKAWQTMGSRMFLDVNSKVKVSELLKGIIVQSGNDASVAIAEHIAGTEQAFASLMNDYAVSLGMHNSHFNNATGLPDPNHYTTAKDLAILAKAIIKNHPESYAIYSQKSFIYNNIEQINRNKLLWRNVFVDGIKTGQTDKAGYCLAVSAVKDDTRLIAILLGAKNDEIRVADANKLLTWGFRFFASHKVYRQDQPLQTVRVWGGDIKNIDIGLEQDVYVSILRNNANKISTKLNIPNIIKAPLDKGAVIGNYIVKMQNEVIAEYPVIALSAVKKGHLLKKISDKVAMYYSLVFGDLKKLENLENIGTNKV